MGAVEAPCKGGIVAAQPAHHQDSKYVYNAEFVKKSFILFLLMITSLNSLIFSCGAHISLSLNPFVPLQFKVIGCTCS